MQSSLRDATLALLHLIFRVERNGGVARMKTRLLFIGLLVGSMLFVSSSSAWAYKIREWVYAEGAQQSTPQQTAAERLPVSKLSVSQELNYGVSGIELEPRRSSLISK
jgi:hypothetical protein